MSWHPKVKELLESQNYQALANYYEGLVENEPDEISNYWYLGLAYLLEGKEEEAQITWFIVLSELENEEEVKIKTEELTQILEQEAQKQEQREKNYQKAWVLRLAFKEINPSNLQNLLSLISLSIDLKIFQVQFIIDWGIREIFKTEKSPSITVNFLEKVLRKILNIPNKYHAHLAELALVYTDIDDNVLNCVKEVAKQMVFNNICIEYGIDLLKVCLKFRQDRVFLINLCSAYRKNNQYKEAISVLEYSIELSTKQIEVINNKSLIFNCYLSIGKWHKVKNMESEFLELWNQLITEKPSLRYNYDYDTFIVRLLFFLYLKDDLAYNRRIFNQTSILFYEYNKKSAIITYPQSKEIRPLKIGYIGHTFNSHSVGFLSRWLIHYHDSQLFETYIYLSFGHSDNITEKYFKSKSRKFFSGDKKSQKIIDQIKKDQIDILVDVDSTTSNITPLVLIEKPAPIQITWLGLDASGLPCIDYYIADPYVLPSNAQEHYREKIWRLPNIYLAVDGFEIGTPSLKREDLDINDQDVVFMNLQIPAKLNPSILEAQLKIIKTVPNSYLVTKIRKDEQTLRELVLGIAQLQNISPERLRFLKFDFDFETYRANLRIADVILDTYPYNGSTTTLEALWCEIPVVTRVGEQFAARNSYTYMMNAGITEGIAWSDEEYIEWGIKLGTDENLRKEISWKLKQSKKTSPLWNGKQFAREMENAYRQMWEIYIKENS